MAKKADKSSKGGLKGGPKKGKGGKKSEKRALKAAKLAPKKPVKASKPVKATPSSAKNPPKTAAKPVIAAKKPGHTAHIIPLPPVPKAPAPAAAVGVQLQTLLDRQAIADVVHTYARALDRHDATLLAGCYTPDATEDRGAGIFQGTAKDFTAWIMAAQKDVMAMQHFITNIRIDLDGDAAYVESYFLSTLRLARGGVVEDLFRGGRYLDRFARQHGAWKIAHRKQLYDWARTVTASDNFRHQNPESHWGIRGPADLSYKIRNFPGPGRQPQFARRSYDPSTIKF